MKKKTKTKINKFIEEEEEGAAMAEYALLLSLLVLTTAVVITVLGTRICNSISMVATHMPGN